MRGMFWELVGLDSTYSRAPGSGSPAGPNVDALIHQGICKMVREARPLQVRALREVPITAGTAGPYSFSADMLDFLDGEEPLTLNGYPLRQVLRGVTEQMSAGETTQNDQPLCWYEMGVDSASPFARRFGLYPTPAASGTVKVPYLRTPLELTATGIGDSTSYPDLPVDFHDAPVFYAAWRFYQNKRELPGEGKNPADWLGFFAAEVERLKRATRERLRATFRSTTPDALASSLECWMPCD